MSVAIPEDIVKETVSKTEKTEKYSAKLTPDAPPFFTSANVTKNEDTFELMKAICLKSKQHQISRQNISMEIHWNFTISLTCSEKQ